MIIVKVEVWPEGNVAAARELLHAEIVNVTQEGTELTPDSLEQYVAHVICRPYERWRMPGYVADLQVSDHVVKDGIPVLVMAALGASCGNPDKKLLLPRTTLVEKRELAGEIEYKNALAAR